MILDIFLVSCFPRKEEFVFNKNTKIFSVMISFKQLPTA